MSEVVDRALNENRALIAAILDHNAAGRHDAAVALLDRLQTNIEFIAAVADRGLPVHPTTSNVPATTQLPVAVREQQNVLPPQLQNHHRPPPVHPCPPQAQLISTLPTPQAATAALAAMAVTPGGTGVATTMFSGTATIPTIPAAPAPTAILQPPNIISHQPSAVGVLPSTMQIPSSSAPRLAPMPGIVAPIAHAPPRMASMFWAPDEHARFEHALRLYGTKGKNGKPDFKAIATHVGTRNPKQVRTHFMKTQTQSQQQQQVSTPMSNSQQP